MKELTIQIDCDCLEKRPCCDEQINILKAIVFRELIQHHQWLKHSDADHTTPDSFPCDCNRPQKCDYTVYGAQQCYEQKIDGKCIKGCREDFEGIWYKKAK